MQAFIESNRVFQAMQVMSHNLLAVAHEFDAMIVVEKNDDVEVMLPSTNARRGSIALLSDWIVVSPSGVLSVMKDEAFRAKYEPLSDNTIRSCFVETTPIGKD